MKFIWKFEFSPEDTDKVRAKNMELDLRLEKYPDKYPRFQRSHMTGRCKGFRIIEVDHEDQLINLVMHFFPEEKWELEPIFEGAQVSKLYREKNM